MNNDYNANWGPSLPNGKDATYNAALSPLFHTHAGYRAAAIQERGSVGQFWSRALENGALMAHNLTTHIGAIWPSDRNSRAQYFSLRCLVSTNNT